jgi:hypothetical protein
MFKKIKTFLYLFQGYEVNSEARGQGEESDRKPTNEIGEN